MYLKVRSRKYKSLYFHSSRCPCVRGHASRLTQRRPESAFLEPGPPPVFVLENEHSPPLDSSRPPRSACPDLSCSKSESFHGWFIRGCYLAPLLHHLKFDPYSWWHVYFNEENRHLVSPSVCCRESGGGEYVREGEAQERPVSHLDRYRGLGRRD